MGLAKSFLWKIFLDISLSSPSEKLTGYNKTGAKWRIYKNVVLAVFVFICHLWFNFINVIFYIFRIQQTFLSTVTYNFEQFKVKHPTVATRRLWGLNGQPCDL